MSGLKIGVVAEDPTDCDAIRKHSESPHLIRKPKEALIRLSIGSNRRPRYSTNENASLAEKLDLALCAKRCPAFRELSEFIRGLVEAVAPKAGPAAPHPAVRPISPRGPS